MTIFIFSMLFILFLIVFGLTFFLINLLLKRKLNQRLAKIKEQATSYSYSPNNHHFSWENKFMRKLIDFSSPDLTSGASPIKLELLKAGYRNESVMFLFYASKTILAIACFLLCFVYLLLINKQYDSMVIAFICLSVSLAGYYFPNIYLRYRINKRKQQIFETLPDALDLIRICVSSGLGLDAAISRVGKELSITSRALSDEFHQLSLELRAGSSRANALKNLGNRTGVEDIHSLVTMLIQSERFGTSVAESLAVHAEGLRSKRKLQAQETAAKIPAKLSIPMILCIFPALFVVIIGPSVLSVLHMLAPMLSNRL